jgi:CubicO group peptidase (beta-lactamase class C family)
MTSTSLVRSGLDHSRLATGYTLDSGGVRAVADYEVVTAAAGAAWSTPADMARYVAAMLGGGANEHGSVLQPATLAATFEPHDQPDPRIPGMGLAFFRGTAGGHPVIEHQGVVPGFNSQIILAPRDGTGAMACTNGVRQAMSWLSAGTAGLLHHLLGAPTRRSAPTCRTTRRYGATCAAGTTFPAGSSMPASGPRSAAEPRPSSAAASS